MSIPLRRRRSARSLWKREMLSNRWMRRDGACRKQCGNILPGSRTDRPCVCERGKGYRQARCSQTLIQHSFRRQCSRQMPLAGAHAQLAHFQSGTRPQQLQIDQSAVASADQSLGIAVGNAYSASDDAVRNQLDNMFSNTQTNNPTFLVTNNDPQTSKPSQAIAFTSAPRSRHGTRR